MSTISQIQRYVPAGAELVEEHAHLAQIYVYYSNGRPCAISYKGKQRKAEVNYAFSTAEKREDWIKRYTDQLQKDFDEKQQRKAAIKAFVCPWQVGDILNYSWGWEQTNQDFYQIVELKGKTVVLQSINTHRVEGMGAGMSDMSDYCIGVKDSFKENSQPFQKLIQNNGKEASVKMSYGYADLWDGSPQYRSWYA